LFAVDKHITASNGDGFSLVKTVIQDDAYVYELRRTSRDGKVGILWKSAVQSKGTKPWPDSLFSQLALEPIDLIYEHGGELSLLGFVSESDDAFVFRFAVSATITTPVRIRGVRRFDASVNEYTGFRFKNHGELGMVWSGTGAEELIRFDQQGNITDDLRTQKTTGIVYTRDTSVQPAVKPVRPANFTANPDALEGNKHPETKPLPTPNEKSISTPNWSIIAATTIIAVVSLFWLMRKRRS
jgi:hypothetical protein